MLVFVYGTLMQGRENHEKFLSEASFKGQAHIEGYALYDLGSYPGIIAEEEQKVLGEVYEIDAKILRELDWLEDEGDLYQRVITKVFFTEGSHGEAYVYRYLKSVSPDNKVLIHDQPWK